MAAKPQLEQKPVLLTEEDISSLNCPVCFEIPNENQIYQCENGHTTCTDCYLNMQNKNCPQCRNVMFKTRFTNFVSNNVLPKYLLTYIMGPIIYFFEGISPSRHKWFFFI